MLTKAHLAAISGRIIRVILRKQRLIQINLKQFRCNVGKKTNIIVHKNITMYTVHVASLVKDKCKEMKVKAISHLL